MNNTIRDKIRKLLAVAEGQANEHESARAMELASRLMMEHGIERDSVTPGDAKASMKKGDWFEGDHKWQFFCAQAAGELYGCMVLVRGNDLTTFRFAGRSDNVDAAQDTAAFIILQVEALYKSHLPKGLSKRDRAEFRQTFKLACAIRVLRRCQEIAAGYTTGKNALVVHRATLEAEINEFIGEIPESKAKLPSVKISAGTIVGTKAGNKVDLNRSVPEPRMSTLAIG